MKVAHFAPFAPYRCGLYEAARDFVIADRQAGRDAVLIDTGLTHDSLAVERHVGEIDERGGTKVQALDYLAAYDADVLVYHAVPTNESGIAARTDAPAIWMLHGRPKACWRDEVHWAGKATSYSLFEEAATWPRTKLMVTMWPEHEPYWANVLPGVKLRSISAPPVDPARFSPRGPRHAIERDKRGEFNVLIADSWRRDEDIFDALNAAVCLARLLPGRIRVHTYALEPHHINVAQPLFRALHRLDALGESCERSKNITAIYRSMDCVMTSHRIATRIVAEALSCGTPVVARRGCAYTPYGADPEEPEEFAKEVARCLLTPEKIADASPFALSRCADAMGSIYDEVTATVGAA